MLDEDKEWVREICHKSLLARKLGTRGRFTEEERSRWESLYRRYKDAYEEIISEVYRLNGKERGDAQ